MAKIQDLIDFGIPQACFCRTDPNLNIDDEVCIFIGITNGYTNEILKKFILFFGKEKITKTFEKYKDKVSKYFFDELMVDLNANN